MHKEPIAGIVLAAGRSARFGDENKLLLDLGGSPVIYHSVKAILNSQASPVFLITGYESGLLLDALDDFVNDPKLKWLHNKNWETGRASSLSLAIENLPKSALGVLVHLGDMPLISTALIDRLIEAFLGKQRLTFPVLHTRKGNPVVWPREDWDLLTKFSGDQSAFGLIKDKWDSANKVPLTSREEPSQWDLDTRDNYQRMLEYGG